MICSCAVLGHRVRVIAAVLICLGLAPPTAAEEGSPQEETAEQQETPVAVVGPPSAGEIQTHSGYETVPQIGGPSSAGVSLIRANLEKEPVLPLPGWSDRLSRGWFAMKEKLLEEHGLAFGASYNVMAQSYQDADSGSAVGGIFDAALSWTLLGHGTGKAGTMVMLVEHQHRLGTRYAPEEAGLRAGSAVPTASFAETDWHLNNFYWSQQLSGNALVVVAGVVDTTDYVDYHALNDPLTAFASYAFAGTPTIPLPVPGTGVMLRGTLAEAGLYYSLGLADGKAESGSLAVNGLFSDPAPFTHLEIGATPSFRQRFVENVHLTLWHQAGDESSLIAEDWGGALSLSTRLTERTSAFLRGAVSRGRSTLLEQSFSFGGAYNLRSFDLLGLGVNWGKVAQTSREQLSFEAFYRFQFGPVSTLTPSIQVVLNPGLEPERESLIVLGMRLRVAL